MQLVLLSMSRRPDGRGDTGSVTIGFGAKKLHLKTLRGARFGVVCRDNQGRINGGECLPRPIPGGGSTRVEDMSTLVSGVPKSCQAYYFGTV